MGPPRQAAVICRYVRTSMWFCLRFQIQRPAIIPRQSFPGAQALLPLDMQCSPLAPVPRLDFRKQRGGGEHDGGEITWLVTKYLQQSLGVRLPNFRQLCRAEQCQSHWSVTQGLLEVGGSAGAERHLT